MNTPSLIAAVVLSSLLPALAITDAEITPTALAGKTLTFTINTAGGAFANTGSWTGTFGNPTFSVANLTGNTVNVTTTHSTASNGFTIVTLAKYIEGSGTTTITLFTEDGIGKYEMNFSPVDSAYQSGTFTIGAAVPPEAPEIDVQQPKRKSLADGRSSKSFGTAKAGKSGITKTFYIKNTGKAPLTGLALSKTGAGKKDFTFSGPVQTRLAPGKSTSFTVTFKPKAKGVKSAFILVKSNDSDENPFDIPVTGTGVK